MLLLAFTTRDFIEPTVTNIPLRYFCCFRYLFCRRVLCAIFFKSRSNQRRFSKETMAPQNILCCNFIYFSIKYTIIMHTLRTNMIIEYKPTKIALFFPQAKKYNRPGFDHTRCHRFSSLFEYLLLNLDFFSFFFF